MLLITSDGVPVVADLVRDAPEGDDGTLPVVLLHGLSQQRKYWTPVVARLQRARRVVAVDQRAHGDAATEQVGPDGDFSMGRLARDVVELLDHLAIEQAIVIGHSWGASVALHSAAWYPHRIRACALIDGGLFGPRHLIGTAGTHEQVREALRPPPLGMFAPALWQAIATGDLSPYWSEELQSALEPTFRADQMGRMFSRIGMDRHMAVLDALFDYDPVVDVDRLTIPTWVVMCEPREDPSPAAAPEELDDPISAAWFLARRHAVESLPRQFFLQRWYGALHDVPLQWPALVAGLVDTIVERTRA